MDPLHGPGPWTIPVDYPSFCKFNKFNFLRWPTTVFRIKDQEMKSVKLK